MFNMGQNKYAAQFTQSREEVVNHFSTDLGRRGVLGGRTVRIGKEQTIPLPPPVHANAQDKEDLDIIRAEDIKTITKRR